MICESNFPSKGNGSSQESSNHSTTIYILLHSKQMWCWFHSFDRKGCHDWWLLFISLHSNLYERWIMYFSVYNSVLSTESFNVIKRRVRDKSCCFGRTATSLSNENNRYLRIKKVTALCSSIVIFSPLWFSIIQFVMMFYHTKKIYVRSFNARIKFDVSESSLLWVI